MGIVNRQSAASYDAEFNLAKAAGIDVFALNMGPPVTTEQLNHVYDGADRAGIKVFISFDFNNGLFSVNDPNVVADGIRAFKDKPA